ncbi:hypothetical protein KIN20_007737 [Parelaphostrongylus tenuis]|uniref:Uncharacterized protein n=1 Tax=Parelaphostrongylus tenuis TaxID=148309 RepID=A0AAD5QK72_PARTN|nr:hypothetical protein KIN20_007737 [Parelaphostrongylus tenuis]
MNIPINMARHPTETFLISLLATISISCGCGVMPAGQASTRPFTVTGLTTLPAAMAAARGFVERLVTQTVFDVLECQSRSALLPDAAISAILGQLNVTISYTPLNCQMSATPDEQLAMMQSAVCIIVDNRVTGICTTKAINKKCGKPELNMVEVSSIDSTHLTIPGSFMV